MMSKLLVIALGGSLGALARYGLAGFVQKRMGADFPFGTLLVNVLGCVAIGFIMWLVEDRQWVGQYGRLFLTIGFLGAFTTFSTFSYETSALAHSGELRLALWNVLASVLACLAGVELGRILGKIAGS